MKSLKSQLVEMYKHPNWETGGFIDAIDKMIASSQAKIVNGSDVRNMKISDGVVSSLDSVQNIKPEIKRKIRSSCKGKLVDRRDKESRNVA
jgi:hypothetical protein